MTLALRPHDTPETIRREMEATAAEIATLEADLAQARQFLRECRAALDGVRIPRTGTRSERILAALDCERTLAEIRAAIGGDYGSVASGVRDLCERGLVERTGWGRYRAV